MKNKKKERKKGLNVQKERFYTKDLHLKEKVSNINIKIIIYSKILRIIPSLGSEDNLRYKE